MGRWFTKGAQKMGWYDSTKRELEQYFGAHTDLFLGMLAATSPNATVKSNAKLAVKAWRQWTAGEEFVGYLPAVRINLERLTTEGELSGQKIRAFWEALKGNQESVVVDRWMLRAAGIDKERGATKGEAKRVTAAVRRVARRKGVTPAQAQAAIWFGIKDHTEAGRGVIHPAPPFEVLVREAMSDAKN